MNKYLEKISGYLPEIAEILGKGKLPSTDALRKAKKIESGFFESMLKKNMFGNRKIKATPKMVGMAIKKGRIK